MSHSGDALRLGRLVAAAGLGLGLAACGSSAAIGLRVSPPTVGRPGSPTGIDGNRRQAAAEAARLMASQPVPPGSRTVSPVPAGLAAPATTPAVSALVDRYGVWSVPMAAATALAWLRAHPPAGLAAGDPGTSGALSSLDYGAPDSDAWTEAQVEVSILPAGIGQADVRVDGMDVWLDPTPLRDVVIGALLRVIPASGCPPSDSGYGGVSNPGLDLRASMLPPGTPSGGLACEYQGLNGAAFKLLGQTRLDPAAAAALGAQVARLPLSHADGEVTSCPVDTGNATAVALSYPSGVVADLWLHTTGCATISNGQILASLGGLSLPRSGG